MFDSTSGKVMWQVIVLDPDVVDDPTDDAGRWSDDGYVNGDKTAEWPEDFVLTDTFCGYMYAEYSVSRKIETSIDTVMNFKEGVLKLVLLDNKTGDVIYDEPGWTFNAFDTDGGLDPRMHNLVAKRNYLFAWGYNRGRRHGMNHGHTLLCIKVDPKNMTCKVRKTNTRLEHVMLAKTLMDRDSAQGDGKTLANAHQINHEIRIDSIGFLGFAFDGVVICQTKISCVSGRRTTFWKSKAVFSVDLDKILDIHEPSNIFSAVNFPLGGNVFDTARKISCIKDAAMDFFVPKSPEAEYYPFYQTRTGQERAQFSGIIEINNATKEPLMPKIYSFETFLEATKLSDEETKESSSRKRRRRNR